MAKRGDIGRSDRCSETEHLTATVTEVGLTRKQIHEARMIRDAEATDPGVIERTAKELVDAGKEPTKAAVAIITLTTKPYIEPRHGCHIDKSEAHLDGELICVSRQPRLDGARELLRRGYSADGLMTTRAHNRDYDSWVPAPIGELAMDRQRPRPRWAKSREVGPVREGVENLPGRCQDAQVGVEGCPGT